MTLTHRLSRHALALALFLALATSAAAQAPAASTAADPGLARLEAQFARLATVAGGATVGVAVVHLETGRAAYLNANESFPMASTFKVPLAVQLLTRAERGEVRIDSMITIRPGDLHPGSGTLTELFNQPGVALSVRNLMELMLRISDNSATDVLLRTAGGPAAVNARLAALGVTGMRVDRPTVRLIADYVGVRNLPSDDIPIPEFGRLSRVVTDSGRRAALAEFAVDPRDNSTPMAMAQLLGKLWRHEALNAANSDLLLDMMARSTTGAERIKGMLPPGTRVAHKTGSLAPSQGLRGGRTVNDVGIIYLPDGAGHLVTVVFVKGGDDAALGERAIAHIARSAYDYFVTSGFVTAAAPARR